jgi:hypothetical protein
MSVPPELAAREGGGNPFVPWPRGRNARVDLYPISNRLRKWTMLKPSSYSAPVLWSQESHSLSRRA